MKRNGTVTWGGRRNSSGSTVDAAAAAAMEQSPSWEAYSRLTDQKTPCLLWSLKFITVFTKPFTGSYREPDTSTLLL
jgi:hypothetical protein